MATGPANDEIAGRLVLSPARVVLNSSSSPTAAAWPSHRGARRRPTS
ncbi:hypothetical protein ACFV2N_05255 [Streptomyces sp. NPDC059680]